MKLLKIIGLTVVTLLTLLFIWIYLPTNIKYHTEITYGNKLIANIEFYKVEKKELPETQDWKVLQKLKFKITDLGTDPAYEKIDENTYKLVYLRGFDGPYLTYESNTKKWELK